MLFHGSISYLERLIEVISALNGHADNLAGVDVHHDGAGTIHNLVVRDALLEALLEEMLNYLIYAEY